MYHKIKQKCFTKIIIFYIIGGVVGGFNTSNS